jgi:hypothetical protein
VQPQDFAAATPQVTDDCQASPLRHHVQHVEYHGSLLGLGQLRQQEIAVGLCAATADQDDVEVETGNIVQVLRRYGACSEGIAPGFGIVAQAICLHRTGKTLQGQADGCLIGFWQGCRRRLRLMAGAKNDYHARHTKSYPRRSVH